MILGCDFDETYRTSDDIRPEELDAVRRFRKAGNLFGIVTGRAVRETLMYVVPLCRGEYDFIICCTGGMCILPDGTYLFRHMHDGVTLPHIYKSARELGMVFMNFDVTDCASKISALERGAALGDGLCETSDGDVFLSGRERGEYFRHLISPDNMKYFDEYNQCTVVFRTPAYAEQAAAVLDEKIAPYGLVTHNAHTSIDITKNTVSKSSALFEYAAAQGVPAEAVCTCGDGKNDADMLSAFNGYAMKNGDAVAIAAAGGKTVDSVASLIDMLLGKEV